MRSQRSSAPSAGRDEVSLLAQLIHDLKNPLGIVLGYAEAMVLSDPSEQAELSARLTVNARLVLEVLDEYALLEGLRHRQVSLERGECDWQALTARVIKLFIDAAHDRDQSITADESDGMVIQADPQRLEQMIRLTVREALRSTPRGAHLKLVAQPGADTVELRIEIEAEQEGLPTPPTDLRIFDPRRPALDLVRRLAELHRGRLSFTSAPQRAVASIQLPNVASRRRPAARKKR